VRRSVHLDMQYMGGLLLQNVGRRVSHTEGSPADTAPSDSEARCFDCGREFGFCLRTKMVLSILLLLNSAENAENITEITYINMPMYFMG